MKKIGKLIVIEGTDGSGKATQAQLLKNWFELSGYSVKLADFPQYNNKSAGLVEEYLEGKYGSADDVNPYRASIFYAVDRYDASFRLREWLDQGKIVIANRYTASSMAHQGCKIESHLERKTFYEWLESLEFKLFEVPRPDAVFILHVEAVIAQNLASKRGNHDQWRGKINDIHEADINHLKRAEAVYLEIAKTYSNIHVIPCTKNNKILPRDEISQILWDEVVKLLDIKIHPIPAPNFKNLHDDYEPPVVSLINDEKEFKISRLNPNVKLPHRQDDQDSYDIYSPDFFTIYPNETVTLNTGLILSLPKKHIGLIWSHDRSSLLKFIDSNYTKELIFSFKNNTNDIINISPGEKIAELLIQKVVTPNYFQN